MFAVVFSVFIFTKEPSADAVSPLIKTMMLKKMRTTFKVHSLRLVTFTVIGEAP